MCRRNDFTSTTTHLVLSPHLCLPMLPSPACLIVLACLAFWNTRLIRGCGPYQKSRLLEHSFAWPGHWQMLVSPCRERTFVSNLGMGTREICVVLHACELQKQGSLHSYRTHTHSCQKLPRLAHIFHLHVTTPAIHVSLSRLTWFSR